jgi:hypothetical protein
MLPSMWISDFCYILGSSLSPVMTYSMMTGNSLGAPNGQDHGTVAIERVVPQPDIVSKWPWQSIWYKQLGHTCACIYIYIYIYTNTNVIIWKSVGIIIPSIWKNKKCSKPPTRYIYIEYIYKHNCSYNIQYIYTYIYPLLSPLWIPKGKSSWTGPSRRPASTHCRPRHGHTPQRWGVWTYKQQQQKIVWKLIEINWNWHHQAINRGN